MFRNKSFLLTVSFAAISIFGIAQNNTNSPYTRYGYGDIPGTYSGEQRAMGGVAFGLRSKNGINTMNPASYSSVDSTTFMFDLGISGLLSRFSTPQGSKTGFNGNLDYLNMQFPLMKNVGFSAGMLPFSFSGYNYYNTSILSLTEYPDTIKATRYYSGFGGISQVYAGLSIELFDHISLGTNAYYMFGSSVNARDLQYSSSSLYSSSQKDSITVNSFRFRFGAQFYNTFNQKHDVTLGLIYEPKIDLKAKYSQATKSVLTDLTPYQEIHSRFEMPEMLGAGLSYTFDKKLTLAADYSLTKWGEALYMGVMDTLNNQSKFSLGAEYQPNIRGRYYYEKIYYRAGLNLSEAYYKIGGIQQPKNFGITFGLGLPMKLSNSMSNISMVNLTFEYGKSGNAATLREDYFKFTLNAAFNELWFFKRKL